jgi:hypothetical protein
VAQPGTWDKGSIWRNLASPMNYQRPYASCVVYCVLHRANYDVMGIIRFVSSLAGIWAAYKHMPAVALKAIRICRPALPLWPKQLFLYHEATFLNPLHNLFEPSHIPQNVLELSYPVPDLSTMLLPGHERQECVVPREKRGGVWNTHTEILCVNDSYRVLICYCSWMVTT